MTFAGSETTISYVAASTALPVTFANSASAAAADQQLTFTGHGGLVGPGLGVDPVYRAFVPVYVRPAGAADRLHLRGRGDRHREHVRQQLEHRHRVRRSISRERSPAPRFRSIMDGGTTAIATGTVASGATTITLTTDGTTTIADGNHQFTVEQSIATPALSLYADWTSGSSGLAPGAQFPIAASSVNSPASAGTALTIGLAVLAPPASTAQVGVPYTYTVQTNAPSSDTVTVTHRSPCPRACSSTAPTPSPGRRPAPSRIRRPTFSAHGFRLAGPQRPRSVP